MLLVGGSAAPETLHCKVQSPLVVVVYASLTAVTSPLLRQSPLAVSHGKRSVLTLGFAREVEETVAMFARRFGSCTFDLSFPTRTGPSRLKFREAIEALGATDVSPEDHDFWCVGQPPASTLPEWRSLSF